MNKHAIGAAIVLTAGAAAAPCGAMEIRQVGNQLILSGGVVGDEPARVAAALAAAPAIETIVLRNSPGGDAPAGYALGELFRARNLRTAVSGYCYSSCSRMFLGGTKRVFTDDYPPAFTEVGFHGHYGAGGRLNAELVRRRGLKDWIVKHSDGKADVALVERWIAIPLSTGMAHFYHPGFFRRDGASTFLCQGYEGGGHPSVACEAIPATALDLGIVTSLERISSNDRAELQNGRTAPPP